MTNTKKTLILGASPNPTRYAYLAAERLTRAGHPIVLIGQKKGEIFGSTIEPVGQPPADIDTITLYVGPQNQSDLIDYILEIRPKRLIFNPGTYNPELDHLASANGIETVEACTLVLLQTKQY
jgi:predicted CoA-binding protein